MAYVIGGILIIIALIILGLILRKRVYDEVDRLESWKMDIMNKNVTSELSKIKTLNLSGETQEKFESWKARWEHILSKELPDIEEYLLDAEEAADKFKISTANKQLRTVEQTLNSIEQDIDLMYDQLDELLDTEQNSRKNAEELQPKLKSLRQKLIQNRHQYGKAEIRFDMEIDELEKQITSFYELTESGNYHEAQELVSNLKYDLEFLEQQIDDFPLTYKKCKNDIPTQIDDLLANIKEMKDEGYRIEYLGFEKELHKFQEKLIECVTLLEKGSFSNAYEIVFPIEERLEEMYQLLEKEAVARSYVQKQVSVYKKLLNEVTNDFDDTQEEVEQLQKTYYISEADIDKITELQKWIVQLKKQYDQIQVDLDEEETSFIEIREMLENGYKELLEIQESQNKFKEQIYTLRKDEIEAKEKVHLMRQQLFDANRKIQKSNIPGVPTFIWDVLGEATEKSNLVIENLDKQPLDMNQVQTSLKEAEKAVQVMVEQTELLLEQARLVELVIQYANRYRSQHPILAARLYEAENLFREFQYENALTEAAEALEAVEPGALRRLEELNKVPS